MGFDPVQAANSSSVRMVDMYREGDMGGIAFVML
jgi:hypothetical protein